MSRARWISLGALALLLALLPLVPHGGTDDGAIRPAGDRSQRQDALTEGYGRIAPAARREIDRTVTAGATVGRLSPTLSPRTLVDGLVQCARFEGQRYCLGTGWTDQTQSGLRARVADLATRQAARATARTTSMSTGDLTELAALQQAARMSPSARADAQRAELRQAARSVAKVWLIRHQIQGVPLPPHFFARHPEVRAETAPIARDGAPQAAAPSASPTTASPTTTPSASATPTPTSIPTATDSTPPITGSPTATSNPSPMRVKHWRDYPAKAVVLHRKDVAEQTRTYWCGPTTMQMIAWGWKGKDLGQDHWATKLGTTTSGTGISSMVAVVNNSTGWDKPSYAGPYIVLDIGDWTFRQWMVLMARHIVDYQAPVILHPVLLTQFYPYLDHDGSGHFQVGRGYQKRPGKTPLLGYFEPWNQQAFHPDEPFIGRVQWRNAYRSYRANQAHFQHNIGV